MIQRIHITGASGCGTSTLARALANRMGSQSFDTDDFYWKPTDPPFVSPRPIADRLRLMEEMFVPRPSWVLSGSLHSWGAPIMMHVTHVVFLSLSQGARLARLRARERRRFGGRIAPGGDLHDSHRGFLAWAMGYDEPGNQGRSRAAHEAWLATLSQPVIRLDASPDPAALADAALDALARAD